MNCGEFRQEILELARLNPVPESGDASAALRHAEHCEICATLLAEQRALSDGLNLIASRDAKLLPSLGQEEFLRVAYREANRTVTTPQRSLEWKPQLVAIAAMLLLAIAGAAAFRGILKLPAPAPGISASTKAPSQNFVAAVESSPIAVPATGEAPASAHHSAQASERNRKREQKHPVAPRIEVAAAASPEAAQQLTGFDENATDFLPLPLAGDPMLASSGPVIRVEMSGAVLQSLGFPIPGEPSARRIKADLMLGEDGFARAIRFVQ